MQKYIKGLDGLRAIAIILVVIHHSHFLTENDWIANLASLGNTGVDLFFIISGFLITKILLFSKGNSNYFKNFYFRRLLRIVPLYFAVLLVATILLPHLDIPYLKKFDEVIFWPYWLFLSNYYIAYLGNFQHGLIDLSWSLCVEEQFYLFWSVCVYFLSLKNLKKLAGVIIVLSPLIRLGLYFIEVRFVAVHVMSITRMDTLMFGCLLALMLEERKFKNVNYISAFIASIIGLKLLYFLPFILKSALSYTFFALIYTSLVGFVVNSNESKEKISKTALKLLEFKPVYLIGLYSYGIYLLHNPLQKIFQLLIGKKIIELFPPQLGQLLFFILVVLAVFPLAAFSYHFYESWWFKFKDRYRAKVG
jgi:peptidoglycan/LPS O-acetylase OafA/YrhL